MADTNNIDHLTLKILSLLDDIQKPVAQYDISTQNKANEIRKGLLGRAEDERQPIKEQTLDEFNNARQVAYGSNVQAEPLTDSNAPPDNDSDSYAQEYPDHFLFINKKTGKETKVDK